MLRSRDMPYINIELGMVVIGDREFSMRLRTSVMPAHNQTAMLCRISCDRYIWLFFPILGGEVVQLP